jgi:F0F1-type ATP synthase epsilon subunit
MNLQVCIMTPDEIFWNEQAEEIILPTNTGQMGVLTNHSIIVALDIGVMSTYKQRLDICCTLWGLCSLSKIK